MSRADDNYQIPENYIQINDDVINLLKVDTVTHNKNITNWLNQLSKVQKRHLFVAFAEKNILNGNLIKFDDSKTQLSQIFFGFTDIDNGWMHGSSLSEIISYGQTAKSFAHGPDMNLVILEGWFDKYLEQGVTFLDPEAIKFKTAARKSEKLKAASGSSL
jgi:hypothetical protein